MNNICELTNKHCSPCQGGTPSLTPQVVLLLLEQLKNDWQLNAQGHIYKYYTFKDFSGAIAFANQIASIAEQEGHHPNLMIAWGACAVEIWTHKINGLTESDFILAAKIEACTNQKT